MKSSCLGGEDSLDRPNVYLEAVLQVLAYSSWRYPRNSSYRTTFSCLTNTVRPIAIRSGQTPSLYDPNGTRPLPASLPSPGCIRQRRGRGRKIFLREDRRRGRES